MGFEFTRPFGAAELHFEPASSDHTYPREIRTAIESLCSHAKYSLGPAEYNRCIAKQAGQLGSAP